ncbi:MAG: DinB family protein [Chthonomonas sp.]|nr:DinB family protein [Chthonomonas sp.]
MNPDPLKSALAGQFRAQLKMMRQCIELCPDELWASGQHPRALWRIVYHALFYTQYYLMPHHEANTPWEKHQNQAVVLWDDDEEGMPPVETTYSREDIIGYLDQIDGQVVSWLDALDLTSPESGFPWYKIPKLDHVLVNLRHLGIHLGQVQQVLFENGHDPDWTSVVR